MLDILLPETDAGVLAQLIMLLVAYAATMWLLRRARDWQILATGVAVLLLALMGVRALH